MQIYQLGNTWFSENAGGGSDRVFTALMNHLPQADTSVRGVVVGPPPKNGTVVPGVTGVSTDTDGLWTRWRAVRQQVTRDFRESPPDVVGVHFALYAAPVLDRLRDQPLVVHFHGPWAEESKMEGDGAWKVALKKKVEQLVYRQADHFVVLSEAFERVLHRTYGIPRNRISIIPGGVNVDRYHTGVTRTAARNRLGWPTDRSIIVSVRRLVKRVGLEALLRAVDEVRTQVPDVLLLIAGKGPLRKTLEEGIRARNLTDHVRLLGFVPDDDLPFAYRAANVSVMPTRALEGFGLSAVESLAAGTPVLVTPVGGLPDIVRDLSPNLIFDDCTDAALASRLTAALDGSLSLPSSKECQSYATARFDWSAVANRTHSLYQEVCS